MSDLYNSILVNSILKDFQDGNKKIAFKKLEKYIKKYPKDKTAVYNFAYMAQLLGHTDLAIINYKKSNKLDKKNWRSRFNLYIIFIKQKKYNLALKLVNSVLNIIPNYQPALRDKALIYFQINKPDFDFQELHFLMLVLTP